MTRKWHLGSFGVRIIPIEASGQSDGKSRSWLDGYVTACLEVMFIAEGEVWVRTRPGEKVFLKAPTLVIWEAGEWVEHGTETGHRSLHYHGPREEPGFSPNGGWRDYAGH